MKVYVKYEELQEFLKTQDLKDIDIVDDPFDSHYMITGRFSKADYHEKLKGIIIPYTGHNGIDLDEMRKHNLKLFVTPTRSKYVAEKAISLTLTLIGRVIEFHDLIKKGNWANRNSSSRIPWVSIQKKKIGLFGYGRIGRMIHRMLKGFDCQFYTIDRNKEYNDISLVKNLEDLVDSCDIIIIAAPLNVETKHIFSHEILLKMKNTYLVNVGRGKIVEERALYEALKNKNLKGYASDVWYNYPKNDEICLPSDYPIHTFENVVLSNHSGGFTVNTNDEVNQDLVKQLLRLKEEDFEGALDLESLI